MSAQHEFIPQVVPTRQRVPDPCPQHPRVSMERLVECGELHYRCPVCATASRMPAVAAPPIVRDKEPGRLFAAWRSAHPGGARIPEEPHQASAVLPALSEAHIQAALSPDFKPVRLPRLTDAQRVEAWESFETLREPLPEDAWLNSPLPENMFTVGPSGQLREVQPSQPSMELILSELAGDDDDHTETNIRAIRRRIEKRLSGSLDRESEQA